MGIHRGWKKTGICHIEEKCYFNEGREMKEGGIDGSMWDCFNAEAQRRGETQRGLVCARMRQEFF